MPTPNNSNKPVFTPQELKLVQRLAATVSVPPFAEWKQIAVNAIGHSMGT
jgi:hypothetical protein